MERIGVRVTAASIAFIVRQPATGIGYEGSDLEIGIGYEDGDFIPETPYLLDFGRRYQVEYFFKLQFFGTIKFYRENCEILFVSSFLIFKVQAEMGGLKWGTRLSTRFWGLWN